MISTDCGAVATVKLSHYGVYDEIPTAAQVMYAVLTFALPKADAFFQTSNHVTVLHAGCWLVVVACGLWVERETRRALKNGYINLYRQTRLFGQLPVIITTFFNFGLLVLLGLDTWIEAETGDDPISLIVLQIVACVEAAIIVAAGLRFIWIIRGHNLGGLPPDIDMQNLGKARHASDAGFSGTAASDRPFPSMDERSLQDLLAVTATAASTPELSRAQQVIKGLKEERVRMQREVDRINAELVDRVTGARPAGEGDELRRYAEDAAAQRHIASQRTLAIVALQDEVRALEDEKGAMARELRSCRAALRAEQSRAQKLEMYLKIEQETYQRVKGQIEDMHFVSAGEATDSTLGFSISGLLAAGVTAGPVPAPVTAAAASSAAVADLPYSAASPAASAAVEARRATADSATSPATTSVSVSAAGASGLRSPIAASALRSRQFHPGGAPAVGGSLNGPSSRSPSGSYSGNVGDDAKAPDEVLLAMQARRRERRGGSKPRTPGSGGAGSAPAPAAISNGADT